MSSGYTAAGMRLLWLVTTVALSIAGTCGPVRAADEPARGLFREAAGYTFLTFPRRLSETAVEAFTGRSLLVLALAGASVPLLAGHLDGDMKAEMDRHPKRGYYVDISELAGATGTLLLGSAAGILAGHVLDSDETIRTGTTLLEAITVTALTTEVLKAAAHRLRPDRTDYLSFPSGHASSSFAVATVLAGRYGPWAGVPAYAAATAIGVSRLDADRHFLSDVLFGATLGTVIGYSALEVRGAEAARGAGRWTVAPLALPGGLGVGVTGTW